MPQSIAKVGQLIKVTANNGGHNYPVGMVCKITSVGAAGSRGQYTVQATDIQNPNWRGNNLPNESFMLLSGDRKELAKQYAILYNTELVKFNEQLTTLLAMKEKIELLENCKTEEDELKYVVGKTLASDPSDKKLVNMLKKIMETV